MRFANLSGANFSGATLTKADLRSTTRENTNVVDATLQGVLLTK